MKILLDNCEGHITIARMLPYWNNSFYSTDEKSDNRISVTTTLHDKSDIQLSYVRFGIQTGLPKILRLDGIYYDSDTPYNDRNAGISDSHSRADGIIYQSSHSMMMCEKYLAKRRSAVNPIIIRNGIERDWCGNPIEHGGINIVVANKWRRHKRLKEIIEIFLKFLKDFPNSTLHIFGKLHDNSRIEHPKIKYHGHVDRSKLIDTYRRADMALHLSKRDSCPNSVVEYLGAGIPVITTNNCGGATEMCRESKGCYIIEGDGDYRNLDPVPHYRDVWNILPNNVSEGILDAMKKIATEKTRAEMSPILDIKHMAKSYIQYMLEVSKCSMI